MRRCGFALIVVVLCLGAALAGCKRSSSTSDETTRYYSSRGIVRGFAANRSAMEIEHEDIPGFMPSMTMPFPVGNPADVSGIEVGDAISFRLAVTNRDSWIDRIGKISSSEVHLPTSASRPQAKTATTGRLQEGDQLPPFQVINQDGNQIRSEAFRGRPLVLTFIFTRCPIPNFCPLMSQKFSDLQTAIKEHSGSIGKTRLLSISFDPEFDTPRILKEFAAHEQADAEIWTFVTGDRSEIERLTHEFSVYVQTEGGILSHGLATALIGPDGHIAKIWRGNGWTTAEVLAEIQRQEVR